MKSELVYVKDSLSGAMLIVSKAVADQFDYDKKNKEVTPDMFEQIRKRELEVKEKKQTRALMRRNSTALVVYNS